MCHLMFRECVCASGGVCLGGFTVFILAPKPTSAEIIRSLVPSEDFGVGCMWNYGYIPF